MYKTILTGLDVFLAATMYAQGLSIKPLQDSASTVIVAKQKDRGIYFQFDENGDRYLKMNIWSQVWFRHIENNPGTVVNEYPEKYTIDAGIRRMRIQMFGQMSPRFLLMLQMGMNNQSFNNGGGTGTGSAGTGKRASFYIHDAYGQVNIIQEKNSTTKRENKYTLSVGAGLHAWNGVSRLTNASTISLLTADAPIFNWPTIEVSDQLTRMFGIYAKGKLDRMAYRISINKPFRTASIPPVGEQAVDNNSGNQFSFNGYFAFQFMDKDDDATSFYAGSYYGKKKMFNIGAGILHSPKSTKTQPVAGVFKSYAITALGADIFIDLPVGSSRRDMVFTSYTVFYRYHFGPNYLRTTAVMNPGTADPNFLGQNAFEGPGNTRILMGTGDIVYNQTAFLIPKFSNKIRIQPYVSFTYKKIEVLNQPGCYYNIGTNLQFDGNRAKLSLEYGSRPLYGIADRKVFKRAGETMAVLQFWL
jgi:hypothetical protein